VTVWLSPAERDELTRLAGSPGLGLRRLVREHFLQRSES
jgi:hypothetical protein